MHPLEARKALPLVEPRRNYPAQFEVRALAGSQVELSGYASTYDQPYEMVDSFGAYREVARPGMCARTLKDKADVSFLVNHDGLTMARTTNPDRLQLSEDEDGVGLHMNAKVNTARSDVRDLVIAIEDGDITQMSFAFRVLRQQWSPDYDQRDLLEVDLSRGDVSAVNYGANPLTSIGAVQRAFRSVKSARLHSMADELRAGKALSASTMDTLSKVLDLIASADDAVDQAQPLLAGLMGVANPDADEHLSAVDWGAHYAVLRAQEQHLRERRTA